MVKSPAPHDPKTPLVVQVLGSLIFAMVILLDAFGPTDFAVPLVVYGIVGGMIFGVRPESFTDFWGRK